MGPLDILFNQRFTLLACLGSTSEPDGHLCEGNPTDSWHAHYPGGSQSVRSRQRLDPMLRPCTRRADTVNLSSR